MTLINNIFLFTVFLNELIKTGKPVYITYTYLNANYFLSNIKNFSATNKDIAMEMEHLHTYLCQYKQIAGIQFQLNVDVNNHAIPLCIKKLHIVFKYKKYCNFQNYLILTKFIMHYR